MFILTILLTYYALISTVSSECAYFNTNYYLFPLKVCLKAAGQSYSSHWQRCESGTIYWDKFSTSNCGGTPISSTIYFNNGIWNCESGSGHDCKYIIIRNSGSDGNCPNSQTEPYVDWAYVTNQCFNSGLYTDGKAMSCSSDGALNYGTCYDCETGSCKLKDLIKINDQCNNYGEWISLPYGCGNYQNPSTTTSTTKTVHSGNTASTYIVPVSLTNVVVLSILFLW
eukprot:850548_1